MINTTKKDGTNQFVQELNPEVYQDALAQLLGVGFARFVRLENPSQNLHEFLTNLPNTFKELFGPRLAFGDLDLPAQKALKDVNMWDFAYTLLSNAEGSQALSRVLGLLPRLEKKASQARLALASNPKIQAQEKTQARSAQALKQEPPLDTKTPSLFGEDTGKRTLTRIEGRPTQKIFTQPTEVEIIDVEVLDPAKLLEYKSTAQLVQDAHAKGLSSKEALKMIEWRREQITLALPFKSGVEQRIFSKEDIKSAAQILQEGRATRLSPEQIKRAILKAEELKASAPSKDVKYQAQASALFNKAQEQEADFKQLLEGLAQPSSQLEASHIVKSVESIESKIKRKRGDISGINDYLRGAIIAPDKSQLDSQLVRILDTLESQGITPITELHHRQSGYKGIHVQFEYNGVGSEIQLHTAQSWDIKKRLDEIYHILREQAVNPTLSKEEIQELVRESQRIAQDLDLDINALTSFALSSDKNATSEKSVLVRKSSIDLNDSQDLALKSNSNMPSSPGADIAYNRPDSVLNQKDEILTGGKGIDESIDKPLDSVIKDSTTALKIESKEPPKLDPKLAPKFRVAKIKFPYVPIRTSWGRALQETEQLRNLLRHKENFYNNLKETYALERHEGYYTPSNALENTPRLSQKALYEVYHRDYSKFLRLRNVLDSPSVVLKTQEGYLFAREEKWGVKTFVDLREDKEGLWHVAHFGDFKTFKKVDDALKKGGQMLLDQRGSKAILANPAFGENFAEYAGKGAQAVAKLLKEKRGQVAGAFYKEGLGYIDLVWGAKDKGIGLEKILAKHVDDFKGFKGNTPQEKLVNGLEHLIQNGALRTSPTGIKTIFEPTAQGEFRVGLSKGWFKEGDNHWVITAYEYKRPPVETFDQSTSPKGFEHGHLAQKGEAKDSTTPLKDTSKPRKKQVKALESEFIDNIIHDYTARGENNQSLIATLKNYIDDEDFIHNLSKETLVNIEPGLARANDYLMYEQVAKMEEMIQKIEKLDSQAVSPGMRASLAHMQKLKTQQEKELLEIKGLYEKLIAKWEKAHGQKANVVFPAKYTPKQSAQKPPVKKQETSKSEVSSTEKASKLEANPAFGENFAEYAGKGAQAVAKLLKEKRGQVAGAFYKEGLGYIDLVWGAVKNKEGKIQGHGLSKIVEKHLDDFKEFAGKNAEEKLGNGIRDIIHNGEVVKTHNGYNILYQGYKVGLNEGWNEKGVKIGNNRWVVTAYDNSKSLASKSQGRNSDSLTKGETLPLNSKEDTTTPPLKTPQELAELQLEPEQIHDLLRERFSQRSIWDAKHTIANHPVLIEDGKKKIEIAQRGDLEEQARAISEKLSKAPRSQRQKLYEQLEANQDARDIDLHKRIIEGYEREIERAKKYLARYQKAQEFRKNAGDMLN
ncbi:putative barnase/colicin E5 family endoribonuclease [Helicobacter labacensis]|uniref:putative barnase/colicin E5 family endoribonuclease n=1 Tax=Helicobacter labacensis TaxID=2316079 RepID=UPI000EB26F88|nr:hypothetical protein [Helicobacter labacensis]